MARKGWSDEEQAEADRQFANGSTGPQGPTLSTTRKYNANTYGGGQVDVTTDYANGRTTTMGPSSDQVELQRYRGLGEAAANRQAYQVDFGRAQADRANSLQARGQQVDALGLQQQAAAGNAPSRAAIMGNQMAGQSLETTLGAGAGARGLGAAAAQSMAMRGQGAMQLGGMQQMAGLRSQEMQDARGQYMAGASGIRAGDYANQAMSQQQAEAQAQSENAQRRLNQGAQMGYEQAGLNVEQAQLDASTRLAAAQNAENAAQQAEHDARNARAMKVYQAGASVIGAAASDVNTKQGMRKLSFSDAHAKREAYALGRAHQWEQTKAGKPVEWAYEMPADITDRGEMSGDRGRAKPAGGKAAGSTMMRPERKPLPEERPVRDFVNDTTNAAQHGFDAAVDSYAIDEAAKGIAAAPPDRRMMTFQRDMPPPQAVAMSDEQSKGGIASLYEAPGTERHWDRDVSTQPDVTSGASLSGPTPKYSSGGGLAKAAAAKQSGPRKMSDAELKKLGEGMLAGQDSAGKAQLAEGPAVKDDMGKALADMQPYEYEYKPEYGGDEGQQPGEKNVGPMAQDMAKNPITGSAVIRRPDGMLAVDMTKAGKLSLGAIGYLAAEQRAMKEQMARMKKGGS